MVHQPQLWVSVVCPGLYYPLMAWGYCLVQGTDKLDECGLITIKCVVPLRVDLVGDWQSF